LQPFACTLEKDTAFVDVTGWRECKGYIFI
jgi:hypothetical protein